MLINLSNHPSKVWSKKQIDIAEKEFTRVIDIDFPNINPEWDTQEVKKLVAQYHEKINETLKQNFKNKEQNAVHVMGEHTFIFHLVKSLKSSGIICVASTTKRIVEEKEGKKIVQFSFVKFREY